MLEDRYVFEYRDTIMVKGKGEMRTYLLVKKREDIIEQLFLFVSFVYLGIGHRHGNSTSLVSTNLYILLDSFVSAQRCVILSIIALTPSPGVSESLGFRLLMPLDMLICSALTTPTNKKSKRCTTVAVCSPPNCTIFLTLFLWRYACHQVVTLCSDVFFPVLCT